MAMGVMSSTSISTLSPGMHISTPSGRLMTTGDVGRAEIELRAVVVEERGMAPALFLGQYVNLSAELGQEA